STTFWTHHCHAVPLGEKAQSHGEQNGKAKMRKNHICSRCNKIMYPGKEGADVNHKRIHCSDGARQTPQEFLQVVNGLQVKLVDQPPPYPQPNGVFTSGTHFHPLRFLQEVSSLYDRAIVRKDIPQMQDLAFAELLEKRTLQLPISD
ncbi:hypothetical protein C8Q80DRAFT_1076208, partial [Daedaleopsis nitida]